MNANTRDTIICLLEDLKVLMDELRTPAGANVHTCIEVKKNADALVHQLLSDETILD